MKLRSISAAGWLTLVPALLPVVAAPEPPSAPAILQDLRSFREMATVLYVAAHPDDENTQLITFLARGRNYRSAYLSVTRGDGGQNLLGPEFDEELGVIRTQELLAARRLDGGRQFFTRAIDFGYSKDYRETLTIWDREQVLSDVVRVIRTFQPDVVVAGFGPQQTPGQHGQHIASAVLAVEAFKLAGDPKAFPEQGLKPWQPKRLLQGRFGGRGGGTSNAPAAGVRLEISGNDPVSGEPFGAIASRSRAMHKSQGFGGGGGGGGGTQVQTFGVLDGEPATNDIMDGIDTTWNRVPNGAEVGKLADEAIEKFNTNDLAANVPALLAVKSRLAALPPDRLIGEKRRQLDRIIQACLGLTVETTVAQAETVPGEPLKLRHTASVRSMVPVRWVAVRYPGIKNGLTDAIALRPGQPATRDTTQTLPANTPLSQPYWLRQEPSTGLYRVDDPTLIGTPENPPAFPVEQVFEVSGQTLVIADEPVQVIPDAKSEVWQRRRLDVISPVTLKFGSEVRLFVPGSSRGVEIEVEAYRSDAAGTVRIGVPVGWKATPESQPFKLARTGDKMKLTFTVTAPAEPVKATITAQAEVNGVKYSNGRVEIRYSHIPVQLLQPAARLKAVDLNFAVRGRKVGYLPGAGDSVAECLAQMGYVVTPLTGAELKADRLREFDAVVVGIRVFDTHRELSSQLSGLFAYIEAGGTVVMQYNRVDGLQNAPLSLRISNERVTDEKAEMTFLAPDHPALNQPNKITQADFDGWVQERGIYFPNQWDEHFIPILACHDPGEQPKSGALLVAKYGKGYFVYTGLDFFRQLPDGVPGAYRLFANLVSLGK